MRCKANSPVAQWRGRGGGLEDDVPRAIQYNLVGRGNGKGEHSPTLEPSEEHAPLAADPDMIGLGLLAVPELGATTSVRDTTTSNSQLVDFDVTLLLATTGARAVLMAKG